IICKHLKVDINKTIAFGDGENDILLLEAAGIGVAMGNAEPPLKKHADIIAKTNNANGVCEIRGCLTEVRQPKLLLGKNIYQINRIVEIFVQIFHLIVEKECKITRILLSLR
ncbi:HAD hydrolase family protein, partial [bacterium]|nr:HAD hydrolase family protein [bacterium]